jgi:predicted Zn-dependent protease
MHILFESGLSAEANFFVRAIKGVFGLDSTIQQKEVPSLFKYNGVVQGYETRTPKHNSRKVILTNKDLFGSEATSKEDDYFYGIAQNNIFFVSPTRLKGNTDTPTAQPTISESKYLGRLKHVLIHELGHFLVKDQKHYKDYVIVNPTTGHKTPTGMHCTDKRCVMSQFEDLKMLDSHISKSYPKLFCHICLGELELTELPA